MKIRIKWIEDRTFAGETESGHTTIIGSAHVPDGKKPGPNPMETMLIGIAGCTAYDVVHILEKGREAVSDCVVEADAERAEEEPRPFTALHLRFIVTGRGLASARVARAIDLSIEKYCGALATISGQVAVTHEFSVVDDTPPPHNRSAAN